MSKNWRAVATTVEVPKEIDLSFLEYDLVSSCMLRHLPKFCGLEKDGFQIVNMWRAASSETIKSLLNEPNFISAVNMGVKLTSFEEAGFLAFYSDKELGIRSWEGFLEADLQYGNDKKLENCF